MVLTPVQVYGDTSRPRDLFTLIAAAGLLGATAFVAGYFAARRVIRIDPILAMRAL
jgi:ABC-type lipoprotein release transport system permease subunit